MHDIRQIVCVPGAFLVRILVKGRVVRVRARWGHTSAVST